MQRRTGFCAVLVYLALLLHLAGCGRSDSPPAGVPDSAASPAERRDEASTQTPPGGMSDSAASPLVLDLGGGVSMKLVPIPAGTFQMGSPASEADRGDDETQHTVKLSKAFYMGTTEVTQEQYEAVMGSNPSRIIKGAKNPVDSVLWNDATEFCKKMSQKSGKAIRLPTEAEWEYACRAGTTSPFHFGATISTNQANYDGNYTYGSGTKGVYREKTMPVGSFPANAWGLYDMHGNVWEWCQDWYGDYPTGTVTDPTGPSSGSGRVLRGGSWFLDPLYCRSALRDWGDPDYQYGSYGFRVVVVASGGVD